MSDPAPQDYHVGYKKPPKAHRFPKGQSGNPKGRPKRPEGVNLTELLDITQRTKSGSNASLRDGVIAELCRDAMNCKPRSFSRFVKLLQRTGLLRKAALQFMPHIILPIDRTSPESPLTYLAWLEKEGKHELANTIKAKYGL